MMGIQTHSLLSGTPREGYKKKVKVNYCLWQQFESGGELRVLSQKEKGEILFNFTQMRGIKKQRKGEAKTKPKQPLGF